MNKLLALFVIAASFAVVASAQDQTVVLLARTDNPSVAAFQFTVQFFNSEGIRLSDSMIVSAHPSHGHIQAIAYFPGIQRSSVESATALELLAGSDVSVEAYGNPEPPKR
jgi:hypothetical protein